MAVALLTFNLGVEAGQLLFVGAVLAAFQVVRRFVALPIAPARLAAGYAIGAVATIWLLTRIGGFG